MSAGIYAIVCIACQRGDVEIGTLHNGGRFTCRCGPGALWFSLPSDNAPGPEVATLVSNEFVWKMEPGELEQYRYFLDDYRRLYSRQVLLEIALSRISHPRHCDCGRHERCCDTCSPISEPERTERCDGNGNVKCGRCWNGKYYGYIDDGVGVGAKCPECGATGYVKCPGCPACSQGTEAK